MASMQPSWDVFDRGFQTRPRKADMASTPRSKAGSTARSSRSRPDLNIINDYILRVPAWGDTIQGFPVRQFTASDARLMGSSRRQPRWHP